MEQQWVGRWPGVSVCALLVPVVLWQSAVALRASARIDFVCSRAPRLCADFRRACVCMLWHSSGQAASALERRADTVCSERAGLTPVATAGLRNASESERVSCSV